MQNHPTLLQTLGTSSPISIVSILTRRTQKTNKKHHFNYITNNEIIMTLIIKVKSHHILFLFPIILPSASPLSLPSRNFCHKPCLANQNTHKFFYLSFLISTWEDRLEVEAETHLVPYHCPLQTPSSIPMKCEPPNGSA